MIKSRLVLFLTIALVGSQVSIGQNVAFEDSLFKAFLVSRAQINTNGDDEIQLSEAQSYDDGISIHNSNINSLVGLEQFTKIDRVFFTGLELDNLDFTANTKLTGITIHGNPYITQINVSGLNRLKNFSAHGSILKSVDLSGCDSLYSINISSDSLSVPDLSSCQELRSMTFGSSITPIIDFSGFSLLGSVNIQISDQDSVTLIANNCPQLDRITLGGNEDLKTASLETCRHLFLLTLYGSQLENIQLDSCLSIDGLIITEFGQQPLVIPPVSHLRNLEVESIDLTGLAFSQATDLTDLTVSDNLLNSLDLSKLPNLRILNCDNNNIEELDLSFNPLLATLNCRENEIAFLDLTPVSALEALDCSRNNMNQLDISPVPELDDLVCSANNLTELNLSVISGLNDLDCSSNQLIELDISTNRWLNSLLCQGNSLTSIDLTLNHRLLNLTCFANQLDSIIFSPFCETVHLNCQRNNLRHLNLDNLSKLKRLYCNDNSLKTLSIRNGKNDKLTTVHSFGNPDLFCIQVEDPAFILALPETQIDSWSSMTCNKFKATGFAFVDVNLNCELDSGEALIPNALVSFFDSSTTIITTDNDGQYQAWLSAPGNIGAELINTTFPDQIVDYLCPVENINVSFSDTTITDHNLGFQLNGCSPLEVNVSKSLARRCFPGRTTVNYSNLGVHNIDEASIYIDMPKHLLIKSVNKPYTWEDSTQNIIRVDLANVSGFTQGTIAIVDSVRCWDESIRGFTQCIKAWATPKITCIYSPDALGWDKSSIAVDNEPICIGDSAVRFTIRNKGSDMTAAREYHLFYDNELAYQGSFQLNSDEHITIDAAANGQTVRLEAEQHPEHPGRSRPRATIEGCGSGYNEDISLEFWVESDHDDLDFDVSESCTIIRDSYDPNDKLVRPSGIGFENFVPEQATLSYMVRFQNTGNAEAYQIVVVDTLSPLLDPATLSFVGSSHDYTYSIHGVDTAILSVTYKNINLPDSTSDEPNSHGFFSFDIDPKPSTPKWSVVENAADIYFDYNSPIRTNVTSVTLLDTVFTTNVPTFVIEGNDPILSTSVYSAQELRFYPNPSSGPVFIDCEDEIQHIHVYDHLGSLRRTTTSHKLDLTDLPAGMFVIEVSTLTESLRETFIKK